MLPMGFGLLQTLGLMGLLDIPLNQANIIVLPLTHRHRHWKAASICCTNCAASGAATAARATR